MIKMIQIQIFQVKKVIIVVTIWMMNSRHSMDDESKFMNDECETYGYSKKGPPMKVNSKFPNVVSFRRSLNHYALTNEFEYIIEKSDHTRLTPCCEDKKCEWRIHASFT